MSEATGRPHVIVHMTSSIDGRIQSRRWGTPESVSDYEAVHADLEGDAWMCGRITMRGYTRGSPADDIDPTPLPRTDHIVAPKAAAYAVALDFAGRLHWGPRNAIEGDPVVVVVSETVSDQHLNALRAAQISYLFGGVDSLDLPLVLSKLQRHFGVRRLLVEGGGAINGAFLRAGLVDEVSLLLAPAVDGGRGVPAVFDYDIAEGDDTVGKGFALTLTGCDVRPNGVVRLRYAVARAAAAPERDAASDR